MSATIPNVHYQACTDDCCPGCYPVPTPTAPRRSAPKDGLSADRRRTLERAELLDGGTHPATGHRLQAGTSETCGDCGHCVPTHGGRRSYWKCDLVPFTNGAGTDIRKSWPACTSFERVTA